MTCVRIICKYRKTTKITTAQKSLERPAFKKYIPLYHIIWKNIIAERTTDDALVDDAIAGDSDDTDRQFMIAQISFQ